jgi:RNA polymerase sigma-70 factor (ECF subfamily)
VQNAGTVIGRDMTLTDAERLAALADEAGRRGEACLAPALDEDAFGRFYDRTARILWAYLSRVTGDRQAADDLLQETYYRFIRCGVRFEGEAHQRHYLFRIATNLARDRHRRLPAVEEPWDEEAAALVAAAGTDQVERLERSRHLRAGLARLKPRERQLLWLAYAEGSSHREIAEILGLRTGGVRVLLFRARRKLADLLRAAVAPARARALPGDQATRASDTASGSDGRIGHGHE